MIEHLDALGDSAALMGAVNTVVWRDDRLIGENTDGRGFVAALRPIVELPGKRVLIFGAGGAARAIAVELALAGVSHSTVVNRSTARAQPLVDLLNTKTNASTDFIAWSGTVCIPSETDIVVNATSIGLAPDSGARLDLDVGSLARPMIVADAIPNPPTTRLIRDAARARLPHRRRPRHVGQLERDGACGNRFGIPESVVI